MNEDQTVESLFEDYPSKILANDEFEAFESFYSKDLSSIVIWLKTKFLKRKFAKNPTKSRKFRNEGNRSYSKNRFTEAIKHFTSALNYAEYASEEYSLALANRSAAYFHLKEYKACIKDVDDCIKSNYPNNLLHKVYIRKAECLEKIKCLTIDFIQVTKDIILNTDNMTEEQKEKQIQKVEHLNIATETNADDFIKSGDLNFVENPNFAFASESVKLCFDNTRGRHVEAARNIAEGEILFLEDAFFFAPVFTEDESLISNKCHHCLSDMLASVPCKSCTLFLYCNESCRDKSWTDFHQWECAGMTASIWYDLGIAFPAFRAVVKGLKSQLAMPEKDYRSAVEKFGDKRDNYLYFNKLSSNVEYLESFTQILVLSAIVIKYLERETGFFSYAEQKLPNTTPEEIKIKCGGLIMRHILQLSGNSSVIEHWNKTKDRIPAECSQIACAIYPSVSMMNHSCKPNITIYYDKTTAIVRALYDIKEGEEIFNCYGVDYRCTNLETRRNILKTIYYFTCQCEICRNPLLEYDLFNCYLCQKCDGPLSTLSGICYICKKPAILDYYKRLESQANNYIEKDLVTIDDLHNCYKIRSSIYVKNHIKISECFDMYSLFHKKEGNLMKTLEYFKKSLDIRKITLGYNARSLAMDTIQIISSVVEELKNNPNEHDKMDILKEIGLLYANARKVLLLYYSNNDLTLTDIDEFVKKNCVH